MEFQITPASPGATAFLFGLALLMAVMAVGFGWLATSAGRPAVTVNSSEFVLKAPFYGRAIGLTHLDLESARVVNLDSGTDLRPTRRTNGVGLPGLGLGWFKLASGEKALAAITSRQRVVYIPTDEGYALLLSVERPEAFLEHATRVKMGS